MVEEPAHNPELVGSNLTAERRGDLPIKHMFGSKFSIFDQCTSNFFSKLLKIALRF
jgi:hypothetical protein